MPTYQRIQTLESTTLQNLKFHYQVRFADGFERNLDGLRLLALCCDKNFSVRYSRQTSFKKLGIAHRLGGYNFCQPAPKTRKVSSVFERAIHSRRTYFQHISRRARD